VLMMLLDRVQIRVPSLGDQTRLPVYFGASQFLIAFGFAMVSAIAAAWLPARKAGRVQPVDILRGSM